MGMPSAAPIRAKVKTTNPISAITQGNHGFGVDAVEQLARFGRRQYRGLVSPTTCLGPRTAGAGLTARTWPTTRQSKSMRTAASRCLTVGGENPRPRLSTQAATCTGSMSAGRGGLDEISQRIPTPPGNKPCACWAVADVGGEDGRRAAITATEGISRSQEYRRKLVDVDFSRRPL
jgi:hypothetical protein